jgi:hypothetical protein
MKVNCHNKLLFKGESLHADITITSTLSFGANFEIIPSY